MTTQKNMTVVNGVRYRIEDAIRLGLVEQGEAPRAAGVRPAVRTDAPSGLVTSAVASLTQEAADPNNGGQPPARPSKSGTKADWVAFALANGKTEADLDGLKRDDIAALFPAE